MRNLLLAIGFAFCFQTTALADPLPAGSTWQNQGGSLLNVGSVSRNGSFRGTYINNAPGFGCQGTPCPATGRTTPRLRPFSGSTSRNADR
jgi:avidin family protein